MELRRRAPPTLSRALAPALLCAAWLVCAPGAALAAPPLERPASETRAPAGYELTAREAVRIAAQGTKLRAERPRGRRLEPTAYTRGPGRWQVSWFARGKEVVQTRVDDRSGAIVEEWTGDQVAWSMARGYPGAFGRKLNAPYVWVPLCLLFLAPFVDPRRPLRILHLDLLVLLGFSVSHVFFNRGEIGASVPLVYPALGYLLARLLWTGFRPRERRERLVPLVPMAWLAVALVALVAFRIGLNVVDSNVIDVGYAGVVGADRIADGDPLYGDRFSDDIERGDTYGPLTYLAYVPFEQILPWDGGWGGVGAAHGAALSFDLLTLIGLVLLGRRLRPGSAGRELGIALGYAWATYPYALFALQTNSNDALLAALAVLTLLVVTIDPARPALGAAARAAAIGLGAAAKFAPLALAPLLAARPAGGRARQVLVFAAVLVAVLAAGFLPFAPEGGVRELYDRTLGYQAGRPSPFSVWGQAESLAWLQTAVKVAAAALAVLVAFLPRRRGPLQIAALGAAVLIAVQLAMTHWFYLYVAWFAPLAFVALLGAYGTSSPAGGSRSGVESGQAPPLPGRRPGREEAVAA